MSESASGKMPKLVSVPPEKRRPVFRAVESLTQGELANIGIWEKIARDIPDATLKHVDARQEGVFSLDQSDRILILADVSVAVGEDGFTETLPMTLNAKLKGDGSVEFLPLATPEV